MLIEGFGIAGYRSFGQELQMIGPCGKVNLLVGQNNSGKSNVLLFLKNTFATAVESIRTKKAISLETLDWITRKLLVAPGAAIFHVRLQDGSTTIERVEGPAARSRVCVDLGYRASDLVQANCVIWVEGPSDRIYLNHGIKAADKELIEGVHYSIMFYGGRL